MDNEPVSFPMPRKLWIGTLGLVLALTAGGVLRAQSSPQLVFIGVTLDNATEQADRRLVQYFLESDGIRFQTDEVEYGEAIRRLVNRRREDDMFVARMTPYAYVVAELLGAKMEPLATYVNKQTAATTYRSYFVVSRSSFSAQPTLSDLLRYLQTHKPKARFAYHSEYSTSSFFLPSLWFRSNRLFEMKESSDKLTAITLTRTGDESSSALVERVARGEADIAAVWDGVKNRFETDPVHAAVGRQVYFVPLPTLMPNDLLVCAADLDPAVAAKLRASILAMPLGKIGVGDFDSWRSLNKAEDARVALGNLRQAARDVTTHVPVEIRLADGAPRSGAFLVDAVRQGVRLSGTELTIYDGDFHKQPDMRWTIEPIHDGAVVLHSTIPTFDVDEQRFQISFRDEHDLASHVISIIQSRLHRIRYVWPYSGDVPIVIRDSAFLLPVLAPVKVQRITWRDPESNQFVAGAAFESRVTRSSFFRYELDAEDFSRPAAGERPGPLSDAAYRVVLVRPDERPWLFRLLTMALVGCFALAGISAGWSMLRRPAIRMSTPGPPARSSMPSGTAERR